MMNSTDVKTCNIKIDNELYANVELSYFNGVIEKKSIYLSELVNQLISASNSCITLNDNFVIPDWLYSYKDSTMKNTFSSIVVLPAKMRSFKYFDSTRIIPFPAMLFYVVVKNGKLDREETKVFALKSESIDEETVLFHYPFGNVYEGGKVCWGSTVFKNINSVAESIYVADMFFGGVTNNDLYKTVTFNKKKYSQEKFIKLLESKTGFPVQVLSPTGIVGALNE